MRKKMPPLTEAELKIMWVLWDVGAGTVHDVVSAQPARERPAYNTILTLMRILEKKGYLHRVKRGRAHVYQPKVTRQEAQTRAVQRVLKNLFEGSPQDLVLNIMRQSKLSPGDIDQLKKMIKDRS